jgi:hypothetical protein
VKLISNPIAFLDDLRSLSPFEIQQNISLQPASFHDDMDFNVYFDDYYLGDVQLFNKSSSQLLVWQDFNPLRHAKFLSFEHSDDYAFMKQKQSFGIGTVAHVDALCKAYSLHKEFNRYCVTSDSPSEGRQIQLRKMGLTPTPLPFLAYLEKSIDYANAKGFCYVGKCF